MATILLIADWRLYFWANENDEPIHIYAEKGDMECKFCIDIKNFEITSALKYYAYSSVKTGNQENHI